MLSRRALLGWSLSVLGMALAQSLDDQRKACEPLVEHAMKAYNAADWQGFYRDFSERVRPHCNEQSFQSVYLENGHKQVGSYRSRQLVGERSSLQAPAGLLVYRAQFSRCPATLSVNLVWEGGSWKILQIRIDP